MDHLLNGEVMFPADATRALRRSLWTINKTMRIATIATMPRWMRKMAGIRQSRVTDALVRPVMRMSFILAHANRHVELAILGLMSPSTRRVMAPNFLDVPPERAETLTPAEARERYGYDKPSEAHMQWRERQQARILVFRVNGHRWSVWASTA